MSKNTHNHPLSLQNLLTQIVELSQMVENIQSGTIDIVQSSNSHASVQLHDVLKSTETATLSILDSVSAIQKISDASMLSTKEMTDIQDYVTRIYEACNFQDITGQRIKKVLAELEVLEGRIISLAEIVKNGAVPDTATSNSGASLLNGPQLSDKAPDQADVDRLFANSK